MAQSLKKKKAMNMAYGLGASVVLIGALFKILHFSIGPLTGGVMLTIGLVTEALIFFMSAFEDVDEDLDWAKVYPELSGGEANEDGESDPEGLLSQKLDNMLLEANLDSDKMSRLAESIQSFAGAAENIAPAADSITATTRYSEQLSLAASQMESLNSLYRVQMDSAQRQADLQEESVENAERLKEQMDSLATNLSSLNGVYGGMLSAMSTNS